MTSVREHQHTPSKLAQTELDNRRWYYAVYAKVAEVLSRYHRARVVGRPPPGPCIYVTHHGSGYFNLDVMVTVYQLAWRDFFAGTGPQIPVRVVASRSQVEQFVPGVPKIKEHFGVIDPGEASCLAVLERGEQLLLMPGGRREAQPTKNFYTLRWENRFGFVRLALKTGAPIVPLAMVGGMEAYPGFALGSLSFWSPLPLPAQQDILLGEPIPVERQPERAEDPALVQPLQKLAWERTQALYDQLRAQRKGRRG